MATPRKRSPSGQTSGFGNESIEGTSNVSEKDERDNLEEFSEVATNDLLEMIEVVEKKEEVVPFFEESIIPTEDPGLRFVETPEPPTKEATATTTLKAPPRRHPRNIPKFSRTEK